MEANTATQDEELTNELDDLTSVVAFAENNSKLNDADYEVHLHEFADKDDLFELMSVAQSNGYMVKKGTEHRSGHQRMFLVEQ